MYNYYLKEQNQLKNLLDEKKQEQQKLVSEETKRMNSVLAPNHDKRIISFLERMQQKPVVIFDSIYKKEQKQLSSDTRRWLNASAVHSLESYSQQKITDRKSNTKKIIKLKLNETNDDIQRYYDQELSILDSFNPKKIEQNKKNKQITIIDSGLIKRNMKINLNKIEHKKKNHSEESSTKQILYFNGLKSLTVQQRMYEDESNKLSISEKARKILEKCNIIAKKPSQMK